MQVGNITYAPNYSLYPVNLNGAQIPPPANDNFPSRAMPRVVALTGLAGSGKSTAADYLIGNYGYVRVKFAGPLKAMLRAIGLTDDQIEGKMKEVPSRMLQGHTPRYAMQTLGSEWGRHLIGPDFWTGLWRDTTSDVLDQGGRVVVDDCRFDNEAGVVRDLGGTIVRLTGRGGIAGSHASEALPDGPDYVIENTGEIADLRGEIDGIVLGEKRRAA